VVEVALPTFELTGEGSLQQQIHRQLVSWIVEGRLAPGDRLPASRRISQQLGVSRNTVAAVLDQLKAEGFILSQVGRGSFVADDLPVTELAPSGTMDGTHDAMLKLSDFTDLLTDLRIKPHRTALPFTPGVPDLEAFPMSIWHRLSRRHQDRRVLMGYGEAQGYLPLRQALADYLRVSRGVRCCAEQILITQGAQQAIALCAQVLLNNGDPVLHENPGYRGASSAFSIRQARQLAVPLKNHVLDIEWIIKHSARLEQAKLLYTCPTHQYPMGGLLSASARLTLLEWTAKHNIWVIEDDYDSEFHFMHKPVAAMQGMTQAGNVIYMGSFSKTLFPALRLGYLVLPESLVATVTATKEVMSGEIPLFPQAVIADFIEEGHFVRHLRRMRQLYKAKWLEMAQRIDSVLGQRVQLITNRLSPDQAK
jgi:GntR family transcriptional regulator/MocR family aminotransferase